MKNTIAYLNNWTGDGPAALTGGPAPRAACVPLYQLHERDLSGYRALLVPAHTDQRYLLGQRELLEAYSTRVFGRPLDGYHEDRPNPGANMDRPGLEALKEAAQTDQVAVIIVEDLDRIARNWERFKDFVAFCEDCVIQLHTCSDGSQNLSLMR